MNAEEIKMRRMEELQQQMLQQKLQQAQEQAKLQQQVTVIESLAKNFMSKEAISRYGNLKAAHPEKAIQVIALIAQAIQNGSITGQISDEEFKSLLGRLEAPKKDFKITIK